MYFSYGEAELSCLRKKDKRLCEVIDRIGHINRAVDSDLFSSVIHHIVGQQISTKAQATIWQRMQDALGEVNAETILAAGVSKLQGFGMTFRKAEYITDFAEKVHTGIFDLDAVKHMRDEDAIRALSGLKGIGVWTAEMILPSSGDCAWSITTEKLTANGLKSTVIVFTLIAAWQVYISGPWQAGPSRK